LIGSDLPEKAINNSVKDYCKRLKRLQAYVSANGRHFTHIVW